MFGNSPLERGELLYPQASAGLYAKYPARTLVCGILYFVRLSYDV